MKKLALLLFVFCAVLLVPVGGAWAEWSKTQGALRLGTTAIDGPTYNAGNTSWQGSFVYYGKYEGTPMVYRVLAPSTTDFGEDKTKSTMLLDCHEILKQVVFHDSSNVWANSNVKSWLNGDNFLTSTDIFTTQERAGIAESTKKDKIDGADGAGWQYLGYAALDKDKVFLLDAVEATRNDYGYANHDNSDNNRKKGRRSDSGLSNNYYWLRSPDSDDVGYAGCVDYDGIVNNHYV